MSEDWTGFCEDSRVLVLSNNRWIQIASFKFSESVCNFFPTLRTYDRKQPNHKLGNKMANSLLVIFSKYRGYLQMQNSYSLISLMENCVSSIEIFWGQKTEVCLKRAKLGWRAKVSTFPRRSAASAWFLTASQQISEKCVFFLKLDKRKWYHCNLYFEQKVK